MPFTISDYPHIHAFESAVYEVHGYAFDRWERESLLVCLVLCVDCLVAIRDIEIIKGRIKPWS